MRKMRWTAVAWLAGTLAGQADHTGTDPVSKYAWAENAGWVNAAPTNAAQTVYVHFDGNAGWLSGYAWGENIGWIKMGADSGGPYVNTASNNWGVNLASNGKLSGYAWGQNVGWITFGPALCDAAINTTNGAFSGHAWGENMGWISFSGSSPDYGTRTMAFDAQPQGTPNWWLDHHGVTESYDAGDGVPAWKKYVMDTNPNVSGDYLRITAIIDSLTARSVTFSPASPRRYYTLTRREDLTAGDWSNVAGQVGVVGWGASQTMQDTNAAARVFYRVNVTVTP